MKKIWLYLILAFIAVVWVGQASLIAVAKPDEPFSSPNWENNQKISQSSGITGAIVPSIAASNNGAKVIVVYQGIINDNINDHDVYYTTSTNYGDTWPTKARIHQSTGTASDSSFVDVTITPNSKGHAVWIEEFSNTPRLVYKYENYWGNNTTNLITISAPTIPTVMAEPRIVAKNNNRLDVVWAQGEPTTNINIYHAYSISSTGNSWLGISPIADTTNTSRLPDIAIDASGNYHVVWEEGPDPTTIRYVRGVPSGNSINWSASINISQRSIPGNVSTATQPKIIAVGNTIHVSYTNFIGAQQQYVHHLQCNSGCTNASNWSSTNNPVSGQVLGAKALDPFDVISTVAQVGRCTFVYFHGIQDDFNPGTTDNERLWGTNSCGNWASSARDQLTSNENRSVNPSLISANNWWLYLTYEKVSIDSTLREIYFFRNQPAIYLPLVSK
ncbi:MAG: hypothetical protein H6652_16630 [Ardenticatenaceae bacterium]|nr:hypothetical protein [Ardenticatenaceae bacterium]MCB8948859.1 hypothetical protein [Ardenticatenaceae bacterium]